MQILHEITILRLMQISGHVTDEEGKKRIALVGKWNSYLDMQKCDEEGTPLPGAELVRLWTVSTLARQYYSQTMDAVTLTAPMVWLVCSSWPLLCQGPLRHLLRQCLTGTAAERNCVYIV